MRNEQNGFTLVEMLIVVIMTSIISIIIFTLGYQYLKQAAQLNAQTNFYGDRLNVADYLRSNIGLSTGLINQNSLPDNNRLVADPADVSGTLWQPIHAIPSTFGNATDVSPVVYYSQNAVNTARANIMNGKIPYQNEFVIYHHGPTSELRVRALGNTSATDNRTVTTCTVAVSGCLLDKVLLTGVKTIEMRYFSRSGEDIDFRSSCDPDIYCSGATPAKCLQTSPYTGCNGLDFSQVEVLQFKIKVSKPIESDVNYTMFNTTIIRIALRNA